MQNQEQLKRIHYFDGQVLCIHDFEDEQNYFLEKHRRQNRMLCGAGIHNGLNVSVSGEKIYIEPGVALDCSGNEIIMPKERIISLPNASNSIYLTISYTESLTNPVPVIGEPDSSKDKAEYSRIQEGYAIQFISENPCTNHPVIGCGRWQACGQFHPIAVALLRYQRGKWKIIQPVCCRNWWAKLKLLIISL